MSLLTICNRLAQNVGLETTAQVITSPRREWAEAVEMSNAVGRELARRVDFGALNSSVTVSGDGTDRSYDLGSDTARLTPGVTVTVAGVVIRPLTQAEWGSLAPVAGTPRYFLLEGTRINFWPLLGSGVDAVVRIQSKNWCSNGTDTWAADTDTSLIDENLMVKGLIVRWRRQKGMDYTDYEAEYEADLADIARTDDRARF